PRRDSWSNGLLLGTLRQRLTSLNCRCCCQPHQESSMKKPVVGLFLAVLLVVLDASTVMAASKTWAGAGPGAHNWSLGANWVGGTAPQSGDDLTFPAPGTTLSTTTNNDFQPVTAFQTLTLDGDYGITGNGFHLDGVS